MAANTSAKPALTGSLSLLADDNEPPPALHQPNFKRHRVLPHPRKGASYASLRPSVAVVVAASSDVAAQDDALTASSQSSSPRTVKQYPARRMPSGPDLPPTPPAHSRTSSATYSALPSAADQSAEDVQIKPQLPTTPTKQMSPPTPDVTPPHASNMDASGKTRSQLPVTQAPIQPHTRALFRDREPSKGAAPDSRTESFKTARENPSSSEEDDEDARFVLRPYLPSARPSLSGVRRAATNGSASDPHETFKAQPTTMRSVGLGLGLETSSNQSSTPKSKRDFVSFDGEWDSAADDVVPEWDDNLDRNVVVRKRRGAPSASSLLSQPTAAAARSRGAEVLEDNSVSPTNATKALRTVSLPQRILTFPDPHATSSHVSQRKHSQPLVSATPVSAVPVRVLRPSDSSESERGRRRVSTISTMSSKSTASTVIGAFLVDTPPQRQRTLRHVKKQNTLRDLRGLALGLSPASSAAPSVLQEELARQRRPNAALSQRNGRYDSVLSAAPTNASTQTSRRDVWKAGAIPVVVVPDRRSSAAKSNSREPSLRSTSSRRSKRSQSVSSVPPSQLSKSRDRSPSAGPSHRSSHRSSRRHSRAYSESDGSAPGDQRTIDYPPIVPRRTSSLSAPTSRNASRSGSLTGESLDRGADRQVDKQGGEPVQDLQKAQTQEAQVPQRSQQTEQRAKEKRRELRAQKQSEKRAEKPTEKSAEKRIEKQQVKAQQRIVQLAKELSDALQSPTEQRQDGTIAPQRPVDSDLETRQMAKAAERPHVEIQINGEPASTVPESAPRTDGQGQLPAETIAFDYAYSHDYRDQLDPRAGLDRHDIQTWSKHVSPQDTPFSLASIETVTTHQSHAEVSEALAVNIYAHQNTSVLVVDHSNRPSDCSDDSQRDIGSQGQTSAKSLRPASSTSTASYTSAVESIILSDPLVMPTITALRSTAMDETPVTPTQRIYSMDDVDSPLRNPRAPPSPPALSGPPTIQLIPATPSGLTPAPVQDGQEPEVGLETAEPEPSKPKRSMSLVLRRALARERKPEYGPSASRTPGLIKRTLSLTRNSRRSSSLKRSESVDKGKDIAFDDEPAEADKLHPFWRPASYHAGDRGTDSDTDGSEEDYDTYRYPPIDNRPHLPRRSLSSRMKKTFAILPSAEKDPYPSLGQIGPVRRTVRRTPSGNLRVMKHRSSKDSLREEEDDYRPYTAPEEQHNRRLLFWRAPLVAKEKNVAAPEDANSGNGGKKMGRILPELGGKHGDFGLHSIPRRLSERQRKKRSDELRQKISGPQVVRDGVGEVIRRTTYRDAYTQHQAM